MRYLEEIYEMYKEQKKNPLPDIKDLPEITLSKIKKFDIQEEKSEITPKYEFGEVYYFISDRNIPIFYMIDGEVVESDGKLYKVYKVSDFIDFATEEDFIFEIDNLPYMVETWNEFYLPVDVLAKSVFVGKLSDKELDILEQVLDEKIEIPQEKRGLTILEDGKYVQNLFKKDEVDDVREFKVLIFQLFDEMERKAEIEFLEEMLYRSLEEQVESIEIPQLAYAAQEEIYAERKDFKIIKENDELIVKITNPDLIGKEGKIHIFNKVIEGPITETFKIKLPKKLQKVDIEYIADNIKLEV